MGSQYEAMAQVSNLGPLEARSSVDILTQEEAPGAISGLPTLPRNGDGD